MPSDPHVVGFESEEDGLYAVIARVDGSELRCPLSVGKDGTLGVKPPRGEWLHTPPALVPVGQESFTDEGEAA